VSELRKVSRPPSRIDRNIGRILVIVLVAALLAVVKPWGAVRDGSQAILAPSPISSPTPSPTSTTAPGPQQYDILEFGIREPPPSWEVWSAGSLASFRFALRVDLSPPAVPASSPVASNAAVPVASASDIPVVWPIVEIPPGSQLDLIALNRPLGRTIEVVGLTRDNDSGGGETAVHPVVGVSPWPTHFTTIGLGNGRDTTAMQPWPTGTYHLALTIGPAGTSRSLEIIVDKIRGSSSPASPVPYVATPAVDPS
jgi:hypothetical protein